MYVNEIHAGCRATASRACSMGLCRVSMLPPTCLKCVRYNKLCKCLLTRCTRAAERACLRHVAWAHVVFQCFLRRRSQVLTLTASGELRGLPAPVLYWCFSTPRVETARYSGQPTTLYCHICSIVMFLRRPSAHAK